VAAVLEGDLRDKQYFVTGRLTTAIFRDDCRFRDPTNDIVGLARYLTALGLLFDPANSRVRLLSIAVTGPREVRAKWTLGGYLLLPWKPFVPAFEGESVYSLDEEGLIALQDQTWSVSAFDALRQTFTPTGGPDAPGAASV